MQAVGNSNFGWDSLACCRATSDIQAHLLQLGVTEVSHGVRRCSVAVHLELRRRGSGTTAADKEISLNTVQFHLILPQTLVRLSSGV